MKAKLKRYLRTKEEKQKDRQEGRIDKPFKDHLGMERHYMDCNCDDCTDRSLVFVGCADIIASRIEKAATADQTSQAGS